jgi:hypothetical protein
MRTIDTSITRSGKKGKGCETKIGSAVNTSITTRIAFERPLGDMSSEWWTVTMFSQQ